jgi:hypothetical protein
MFQLSAIGTLGPLYAILMLGNQNTPNVAVSNLTAKAHALTYLPFSLLLGYLVPLVAMGIPSPTYITSTYQQAIIMLWNISPLSVALIQRLAVLLVLKEDQSPALSPRLQKRYLLNRFRRNHILAFIVSFASHAVFMSLSLFSLLFPSIFSTGYSNAFKPAIMIRLPLSTSRVSTIGEGTLDFMQWDAAVGFITTIMLATSQYVSLSSNQFGNLSCNSALLVAGTLVGIVVVGPGATLTLISWAMDELVLATPNDSQSYAKVL